MGYRFIIEPTKTKLSKILDGAKVTNEFDSTIQALYGEAEPFVVYKIKNGKYFTIFENTKVYVLIDDKDSFMNYLSYLTYSSEKSQNPYLGIWTLNESDDVNFITSSCKNEYDFFLNKNKLSIDLKQESDVKYLLKVLAKEINNEVKKIDGLSDKYEFCNKNYTRIFIYIYANYFINKTQKYKFSWVIKPDLAPNTEHLTKEEVDSIYALILEKTHANKRFRIFLFSENSKFPNRYYSPDFIINLYNFEKKKVIDYSLLESHLNDFSLFIE